MAECCTVLLARVRNTGPEDCRDGSFAVAQERTAFGEGKESLGGESGRNEAAGKEPAARGSSLQ